MQELIDFLLRQEIEEGGLQLLKLEDLQKLDKPFDKGIFDQAFSKVKNFELGKMKHL